MKKNKKRSKNKKVFITKKLRKKTKALKIKKNSKS